MILQSVLHTLAYADVFDYPLTASEVYRYLSFTRGSFEDVLQALSERSLFSQTGEYFTLRGREEIVRTRQRRARVAARLWDKAVRYGEIIACLPFVKMVAVTGSLAMHNTDGDRDVDYMIVTAPGHLWTCRALCLLLARLAKLEGVQLCPNYLLTTRALRMEERTLYVAHELAQMVPLAGWETYAELRRLNDWTVDFLPHAAGEPENRHTSGPTNAGLSIQRTLETIFDLPPGRWLERWEMQRKIQRLTRTQQASAESRFSADECKGHVDRHGEHTRTALALRLQHLPLLQGEAPGETA